MSTHINAPDGAIAEAVLLPGDPLRAKFIAETFLENPVCYNEVRNMFGYTGTYKGKKVSVQGTGMGQPSLSIYVNELFQFYGVKKAIRIGTCGAIHESTKVRDVIFAMGACSDSCLLNQRFGNLHFAPTADWNLLQNAVKAAEKIGVKPLVGTCVSSDLFYDENENWKLWAKYGVLGVEMESAALYCNAARAGKKALCICTVSDSFIHPEDNTTAEERQNSFTKMMEIALAVAED